ncbi:hypothetical protein AGABI1DRAFT_123514 [Agaricus bisporus var. burnettii JB137-S8]|uniref:3'(2'),5'-bisphosphate nucleotidase n=1 Tax=Agaricus bisporus var. burnettii (strain JB137-S8 / ATCC MYA-4627 / FGSC 10392) TaxID=597362 RepID=K5WWA3_AGABU|nr:uncharacterized protein AGABI1DRAFT_123514 [Agaricus bisporus var. burnettii JB137-S8]EKM74852.1 hypothetical protein AGABI1DRAFT_123514 [Agaricus bisporus var. burnettii JB137-S8]
MTSIRSFKTTRTARTLVPEIQQGQGQQQQAPPPPQVPHVWPFADEKDVAISAVRRACIVTQKVFESMGDMDYLTKSDESPVTIGDFAAQALISQMIHAVFPDDKIVGEEDASQFYNSEKKEMLHHITSIVNEGLTADKMDYEQEEWGVGMGYEISPREVRDNIDRGKFDGGDVGRMGFLRGEQYAVCVSLIVDGEPVVGVIGCPNFPHQSTELEGEKGYIFSAVKDQGSERLTIEGLDPVLISMPSVHPSDLVVLESVESAHSSHSFNARVRELLTVDGLPMRMDSQAKYCALAMGRGHLYLRMPTRADYEEKIWDHAPGILLVEEAGGKVTDSRGKLLNFGLGRTLGRNYGIVACGSWVHPRVIDSVKVVIKESRRRGEGEMEEEMEKEKESIGRVRDVDTKL